jgi:hypothetical protein
MAIQKQFVAVAVAVDWRQKLAFERQAQQR